MGLFLFCFTNVYALPGAIQDPDLESGFPVQSIHLGGTYHAGPSLHTLIANIDSQPDLEILSTATALGPLYAWKSDGALVKNWPVSANSYGAVYPAAGNLTGFGPLEIVSGQFYAQLSAYNGNSEYLPGWPIAPTEGYTPPALADIDNDGFDEVFFAGYAFEPDGSPIAGWPIGIKSHDLHTPAIADLDGDNDPEIVFGIDILLYAYHHTGAVVEHFPISISALTDVFPVIGDVDGDDSPEIIVVKYASTTETRVDIYSYDGTYERSLLAEGQTFYGTAPALADIDNDNVPEIVIQTNTGLSIFNGEGSSCEGWPQTLGTNKWLGNSSPVVGDVDGDYLQEIIVIVQEAGSGVSGQVMVYNSDGTQQSHFPKTINIGSGAVPAIADIDLDTRNEIIIVGNYWDGLTGYYDKLWVYDLGGEDHGTIEWGQFNGGPEHRGVYPVPAVQFPVTPPPAWESPTFLPMVMRIAPVITPGIHGTVAFNGNPAQSETVELQFYDGANWSTVAEQSTSINGQYNFTEIPALNNGQYYSVNYINDKHNAGRLGAWGGRIIPTYKPGNDAGVSDFDISTFSILSPSNNTSTTFPVTFEWEMRPLLPQDRYAILLYDPVDHNPAIESLDYITSGLIISSLPPGFAYNTRYEWVPFIVAPDGAIGFPDEIRSITFLSGAALPLNVTDNAEWRPFAPDRFHIFPCGPLLNLNNCISSGN
jgi:hypothetical protein